MNLAFMRPHEARYWLAHQHPTAARLRPLDPAIVERLAGHLTAGTWRPYSPKDQPVVIRDDQLWDGQHRLTAVVNSGVPILVNVIEM